MRVINDKKDEVERNTVDFFAVISHALMIGIGLSTVLFAPLSIILAHVRLTNPWSKVATLGGAVLALLFLEVNLPVVLLGFAFGIIVGDGTAYEWKPAKLFSIALGVGTLFGVGFLLGGSHLEKSDAATFWVGLVDSLLEQIKGNVKIDSQSLNTFRDTLLFEGPYLYLVFLIVSIWLSLGLAAHLQWFKGSHTYASQSLRKLRLPYPISFAFIILFACRFLFSAPEISFLLSGLFRLFSVIMFIHGTVVLSEILSLKKVRNGLRTIIYVFSIFIGFYALVGMGVVSPWFFRKQNQSLLGAQGTKLEESKS